MTAIAAHTRQAPRRSPVQGARPTSWTRFARHYLLMIVAMYAGMLVLDPVYTVVATRAGYPDPWTDLPVVSTLVMTVNMTSPMVLLMLRHGHGSRAILEMAASMVVPTLTAAGLHALGALGADQVMSVAHLAMFPAMLLVMLRRYREYAHADVRPGRGGHPHAVGQPREAPRRHGGCRRVGRCLSPGRGRRPPGRTHG